MITLIREAFPYLIDEFCLKTINNTKHTFVFEEKETNKGSFVTDKDVSHLHIENQTNAEFHFLQNDNCIMKNVKGGQCDYVVFNSKEIHFIDIKVAKGNFANHRKDAYLQIENTFKYYLERINFPVDFILKALVCFPSKRRIIKSSVSSKRKEFRVKYQIDLQEGNYILFE